MRSRRHSLAAAFAALAGMLFLQAAMAFAACDLPGEAASAMTAAMMQPATPECHEADQNTALCVGHCQGEHQTFGKAQSNLPDLSAPPPLRIAAWRPVLRPSQGFARTPGVAVGPPARILFQSLLL